MILRAFTAKTPMIATSGMDNEANASSEVASIRIIKFVGYKTEELQMKFNQDWGADADWSCNVFLRPLSSFSICSERSRSKNCFSRLVPFP